jgi:PAS domain S-box-containing protein
MDTTERKQAEEKLFASERRFRQFAEAIPHHVWTFRADGSVGYYNQRLLDYTGLTAEARQAGARAALHPDDAERVRAAWRHAWETGEPYEQEQRVLGRDGRFRRFTCRAVAVRDASGQIIEWFGTDTDVEDRRSAEEAVNQAWVELAHVNRAMTMGELTASIAHELNQPLAAVVTNANACERWLAASTPNIAEANESLRRIGRDARRASDVIARIRGLFTRRPSLMTQLRIDEVIRDVSLLVQKETRAKDVEMRVTAAEGLPAIVADRVQLQQVILNLVMNAMEAMSEVHRPRILEVRAEPYGEDGVAVSVRDSGDGVNPHNAQRIFDAFFTTKAQGMGMGLAISRSIIEAHGGRLSARNNEGGGATFQFTLPGRVA